MPMSNIHSTSSPQARRHDIDWLRNLALLLLILYHLGMYYVADWGWHIKSDHTSVLLQNAMVMSNLWRMCMLFFISGITLALIESKYTRSRLLNTRFKRLFVPLVFGMAFIVPPQLYYELVDRAQFTGSYWQFFIEYMRWESDVAVERQSDILGLWTWNHLWYLIYLFVYTCLFLVLRPFIQAFFDSTRFQSSHPIVFALVFCLVFLVCWVYVRPLFPSSHGLLDDWWNHTKYLWVMIAGYGFAKRKDIWDWVIVNRRNILFGGFVTYAFVALDRNGAFPFMAQAFREHLWVQFAYGAVITVNLCCWILGLTGYAGKYLNKASPLLSYANRAVLPWYILHQSLIIVFAANLAHLNLPEVFEAFLILSLTLLSCYLGFECIKRLKLLRFLFGVQ